MKSYSPENFLAENFLVPVVVYSDDPENPDPYEGKYFLGFNKFRLPFPLFDSVEDVAEWVRSHPVPVVLALMSCYTELSKTSDNE